jgi:chromatin structure-remodeling complex subunit SFH1
MLPPATELTSTFAARLREGGTALISPSTVTSRPRRGGRETQSAAIAAAFADSDDSDYLEDGSVSNRPAVSEPLPPPPPIKLASRKRVPMPFQFYTDKQLADQSERREILVPVRIEIDLETHRVRDAFIWNLNDELTLPERFAEAFCLDVDIPVNQYAAGIAASIRAQLDEFQQLSEMQPDIVQPRPNDSHAHVEGETRFIVHIDLQVGNLYLRDKFEWDLYSPMLPEDFARQVVQDLGIGGEFAMLIAHSIREQSFRKWKERIYGDAFEDEGIAASNVYGRLDMAFRSYEQAGEWCPVLEVLTNEEVDRLIMDRERSFRRQRRETSKYVVRAKFTAPMISTFSTIGLHTPVQNMSAHASRLGTPQPGMTPMGMGSSRKIKRGEGKSTHLTPGEALGWRCQHCGMDARGTVLVRRGPYGPKTLCNSCGLAWQDKGMLPEHRKDKYR